MNAVGKSISHAVMARAMAFTAAIAAAAATSVLLAGGAFIDALRNGGDLLNVFGDFPTLTDPRHADAYSPLRGRPTRPVEPPRPSAKASTSGRSTRTRSSTWPSAILTC